MGLASRVEDMKDKFGMSSLTCSYRIDEFLNGKSPVIISVGVVHHFINDSLWHITIGNCFEEVGELILGKEPISIDVHELEGCLQFSPKTPKPLSIPASIIYHNYAIADLFFRRTKICRLICESS